MDGSKILAGRQKRLVQRSFGKRLHRLVRQTEEPAGRFAVLSLGDGSDRRRGRLCRKGWQSSNSSTPSPTMHFRFMAETPPRGRLSDRGFPVHIGSSTHPGKERSNAASALPQELPYSYCTRKPSHYQASREEFPALRAAAGLVRRAGFRDDPHE